MTHAEKDLKNPFPWISASAVMEGRGFISPRPLHPFTKKQENYVSISWALSPATLRPDAMHQNWPLSANHVEFW